MNLVSFTAVISRITACNLCNIGLIMGISNKPNHISRVGCLGLAPRNV